jgi:hypothetical protein
VKPVTRAVLAVPLVAAALGAGGATVQLTTSAPLCSAASFAHRVALVVEHGDGRSIRLCVGFDASAVTGEQVLQLSGIEYGEISEGSRGNAVCQIDSEPSTYPPTCWTSTSPYWALFVSRHGGPWHYASLGVSAQAFNDGDAAGFRYESQSSTQAPSLTSSGVCPGATTPPAAGATAAVGAAEQGTKPAASTPAPGGVQPSSGAAQPPSSAGPPPVGAASSSPHDRAPAAQVGAAPSGPLNPGLIAAVACCGALLGLFGARVAARRSGARREASAAEPR